MKSSTGHGWLFCCLAVVVWKNMFDSFTNSVFYFDKTLLHLLLNTISNLKIDVDQYEKNEDFFPIKPSPRFNTNRKSKRRTHTSTYHWRQLIKVHLDMLTKMETARRENTGTVTASPSVSICLLYCLKLEFGLFLSLPAPYKIFMVIQRPVCVPVSDVRWATTKNTVMRHK